MFAQELCHTKGIAKTRERTKEDGRREGVRVKAISVFGVERPSECMTASVTSPAYLDTFCEDGEGNPPPSRAIAMEGGAACN